MSNNASEHPGAARSPGPTVASVLSGDQRPAEAALLDSQYEFLGDEPIPCERYTSREFFEKEMEQLWPASWQWACREEHIPEAGDSYVYDVGRWSVIVVRGEDNEIRAFMNRCTHRGTRLLAVEGAGYSAGFTCPFHGWSWELDGSIRNIPGRWDFPHVTEEEHGLERVSCETWGGFVFINMDPGAGPLSDYLDVMPEHFREFPLDRRRITVHVQKILPANWKAAQEAFMEAYHNFETHQSPNGGNAQYDIFGKYVSRFIHNIGSYSPESLADYPGKQWREPVLTEQELLAGLGIDAEVPEGGSARELAAAHHRETLSERLGVDLSGCSDSLVLDSIEYHLFPNMFFFPGVLIPMAYRFRPRGEDVDSCIFDLLYLEPLPEGADHPEPPEPVRLDVEQSWTEVEALGWLAPVYDQDTGNLQMQQQGLRNTRDGGITLGNYQEARIRRVHMTLDEFLSG
jgi:phenylpropionate dioxygenase-like ring-hydroxylating dioxygenase large terminal subunit